jgi:hypothetical protein
METLKQLFSSSAVVSPHPAGTSIPQFDPALVIIRMPEVEKITSLKRPTIL